MTIIPNSGAHTHLPIDEPAPVIGVLGSCVELQDVAGRDDIATMARHTDDPAQKAALEELAGDGEAAQQRYRDEVYAPNRSVLDLLEAFPGCALPFAEFLDLLPPLRPRYYSISSSPLASPDACSITAGVLQAPARSGTGTFTGVSSAYLAHQPVGGTVFVFMRKPTIAFHPPENPHVPMIMIGAGTGVAPFRGFLQERAALAGQGVPVARSLLFFGCRNRESDLLYADELRDYQDRGLVHVENAFSRATDERCRYVQDAMLDSRGRGVGGAAPRRRGVRLRQRRDDRPGSARRVDADLPRQDVHRRGRRGGLARRAPRDEPLRRGHLGRLSRVPELSVLECMFEAWQKWWTTSRPWRTFPPDRCWLPPWPGSTPPEFPTTSCWRCWPGSHARRATSPPGSSE